MLPHPLRAQCAPNIHIYIVLSRLAVDLTLRYYHYPCSVHVLSVTCGAEHTIAVCQEGVSMY